MLLEVLFLDFVPFKCLEHRRVFDDGWPIEISSQTATCQKNPEKSNALKCWEICVNVETEFPPRYPRFPNKASKATTLSNFKTQFSFCQVLQVERSKVCTSLSIRLSTEFHKSHVFENNKSLQNCHKHLTSFSNKTNVSPTVFLNQKTNIFEPTHTIPFNTHSPWKSRWAVNDAMSSSHRDGKMPSTYLTAPAGEMGGEVTGVICKCNKSCLKKPWISTHQPKKHWQLIGIWCLLIVRSRFDFYELPFTFWVVWILELLPIPIGLNFWIWLRCLEKETHTLPNGWFNGDLPWSLETTNLNKSKYMVENELQAVVMRGITSCKILWVLTLESKKESPRKWPA